MKLTVVFLILGIFSANATVYSQDLKIDFSNKSFTVGEVLATIEKNSDYKFLYRNDQIDLNRTIKIDPANKTIDGVLTSLFNKTGVNFRTVENNLVILSPDVLQKPKTITGKVTDDSGQPIVGVTISVKGTNRAVVTDAYGAYSIQINDVDKVLDFSFVGMKKQEVLINGRTTVNVTLASESIGLDEVVVVGYGTQKKVNLTGSVAVASSADIEKRPLTSGSQVLAGLVTGVQIQQGSGRPGGDAAGITIRGIGTFGAGSSPLILQDGLAVSSLDDIDPDNIKSVSVLKDAAAAAIYGSRAANGVVLIETKRGQIGKLQINYNSYVGWQKLDATPNYVNSATYAQLTGQSAAVVALYQAGTDPDNYPNVSHLRNLLTSGTGFQTNHNISFSGGDEKNTYLISTSYRNVEGITAKTDAQTYNFLFNVDSKLKDNLILKVNMSGFSKTNTQPVQSGGGGIGSIIGYASREPNTYAGLKTDGTFGHQDSYSPEGWLNSPSFSNFAGKDFLGGINLAWTFLKGLTLSGEAGYRYYNNETQTYVPNVQFDANTAIGPNNLNQGNSDGYTVTLNSLLKYSKTINKHDFTILAGYQQESNFDESFGAYRDNFPNNSLYQLNAGASTNQQNSGSASRNALQSYFGRINYDFDNKYLFEANFRDDGSSRFPSTNRFAFFPSVSIGWKISEESFIKNNFKWIDLLKLRASTGSLGNQSVPNYPYQNNISLGQNYDFGGVMANGAAVTSLSNANITWETTTTSDLGLDFNLFKGRLDGTVEIYNKVTTGILYVVPVSGTLGLSAPTTNAGAMKNVGFEANIKYSQSIGKFNFSIAPNFSYDHSEITKIAGNIQNNINAGLFVGQPLNPIYGYVADGIFTDAADVASYPTQPIAGKPGVIRFKDISGPNGVPDGKVDATYDRTIIGNTHPKYSFGATINAAYKGFDVSLLFAGLSGYQERLNYYSNFAYYNGGNIQQWQVDNAWTTTNPNPNAKYPQITNLSLGSENVQSSSFWVKNASFLRLKNVQIGYSFSNSLLQKIHVNQLRIYVGGQNLFSWNHFYTGYDPEENQAYNDAPNYYPITSVYTVGLNVKF